MMNYHTGGTMPQAKIAITIDENLLTRLDRLVSEKKYPNRSRAMQEALSEKLDRIESNRLERECARLDLDEEKRLAEEAFVAEDDRWPEY